MGLQFVFGASGAGKTEYFYRQFLQGAAKDPKRSFFLVVPEQDTLQTQQGIVGHAANAGKGILNIDVLSFNRLAYRVFEEQGMPALNIIDDMGKMMILRSVAEDVREELHLYGNQLNRAGFLSELKSQISELYQYRILPEMVELAAEKADSQYVRAKLMDLACLYRAFRRYMEEHGFVTSEEVLDRLLALLPDSKILNGALVALDGFSDFAPVQQDIIREMLQRAERVLCAVTLDDAAHAYEKKGTESLFCLSSRTVASLVQLAKEAQVKLHTAVDLNRYDAVTGALRAETAALPRFEKAPMLDHLQRQLYRYPKRKSDESVGIRLWEAEDQASEIGALASEIARLVREEGLRYRDIGVIVTDAHAYEDIFYEIFSNAGIPYFLDSSKGLMASPYVEVMRAALEVLDKQFSYEAVMRFLRALPPTDAVQADAIDCFDNYLRASGVRGVGRYNKSWDSFEEERVRFIGPLLNLRNAMSARGVKTSARIAAVRELLETLGAAHAVEELSDRLAMQGDQNRALLYRQGIDKTQEVLERLERLLGDTSVSLPEFRDILDAGLSEASVTVIPATLDQVIIGDMMRSRFAAPKHFFLVGANADQIPRVETRTRIISDRDRALFESLDCELAPTNHEDALLQRFYLYRALLNPSEELVISWSLRGRGGKGLKPSALVGELLSLFPKLKVERLKYAKMRVYTEKEGLRQVAEGLSGMLRTRALPKDQDFLVSLRVLMQDEAFHAHALKLLDAAFTCYTGTALDKRAADAVYGELLNGSITRLELFNSCAYAHFLRYGLKLAERKQFELQVFDLGNLYHAALEACFRLAMKDGKALQELSDEELDALVEHCVNEVVERYDNAVLRDKARSKYLIRKLNSVTRTTLWALREQLRRGDFEVNALEREFSLIEDGVRLSGRIDRIDTYEDEGHVYVKVIDYKTGKTRFDLNQICNGLQLQLAVYMDVAIRQFARRHPEKEVNPAAMFYYKIDDPILDYEEGQSEEEAALARLRALRMDGLVNTDLEVIQHMDRAIQKESDVIPVSVQHGTVDESKRSVASTERFQALETYVRGEVSRCAKAIRAGEIKIQPMRMDAERTACTYCPYHAVCGFDQKLDGFHYRRAKTYEDGEWSEILQKVQGEKERALEQEAGSVQQDGGQGMKQKGLQADERKGANDAEVDG